MARASASGGCASWKPRALTFAPRRSVPRRSRPRASAPRWKLAATGSKARLREVDHSLVDLAARLAQEQIARETAEAAFVAERAAREQQIEMLRRELQQRDEHVEGVQRQVSELRTELVAVLGGMPLDNAGAKGRIEEIKRDLLALGERALTLERERDEAQPSWRRRQPGCKRKRTSWSALVPGPRPQRTIWTSCERNYPRAGTRSNKRGRN